MAALLAEINPSAAKKPESWNEVFDPAQFLEALRRQGQARLENFAAGVRAYHDHPFRRSLKTPPAVWKRGAAKIIDYGGPSDGPAMLVVPSLVNRGYIVDLAEDRSFMRAGAKAGLRSFLLDWGEPTAAELAFNLEDYIAGVLIPALEEVRMRTGKAPRLVGYCMGGTMSVPAAVLRPDLVSALAPLAAPWDFYASGDVARTYLNIFRPALEGMIDLGGCAPVDLLQMLFAALDPTLAGRKFRRFAALDPASDHAERFVELEDWLNDGVPLAGPVARETLFSWYGDNQPARKTWMVDGTAIDPARIQCPTLAVIPSQDRIVPPDSALALAKAIPGAMTRKVALGHIGMMAGGRAPGVVYGPLLEWLKNPVTA